MRVFISEYLVGGACIGGSLPMSMRREGLAMLQAVVDDIARIPGHSVVTTFEKGISVPVRADVFPIETADQEAILFRELLKEVDAVLVIAPETDRILADRCRLVCSAGVTSWNCTPEAIELCGDKWMLADHLRRHDLPTIPTEIANRRGPPLSFPWPVVLKPRDGAGSQLTFLVRSPNEWKKAFQSFEDANVVEKCLVQSFIAGRALSIGVNIGFGGQRVECLLAGEQRLSNDGRFRYLGGTIPASISVAAAEALEELVLKTCRTIPGLFGYVGFDLLLSDDGHPYIVEINPRLTTSYVGYRQIYRTPLPAQWTSTATQLPRPNLDFGPIVFHVPE